ncbi:MAG: endonuclease MutS2 [Clostridiales bacterium]|nr:endonuclease MutS2 [Clostridiales bacterium]MCF8023110.1 endonuclease MutS2 [Clostridiales bacterium]
MDQRNLKRLEYDKLLQKLSEYTRSSMGRELVEGMLPKIDVKEIKYLQSETTEGRELLRLEPGADISGWEDIRDEISRAARRIVLDSQDLYKVSVTLSAARRIKNFLFERQDKYKIMGEIALGLGNFNTLENKIDQVIAPGGEISDNASPELNSIRKKLVSLKHQIKDKLEQIIRSSTYQKYLQDPIVTVRENRYVVPVKQEYRGNVKGIVHDQSSSGATVFVEPMQVVEANNEVRRLLSAEKQEIHRILSSLTDLVAGSSEELLYTLKCLAHLDFIMAKSRFSGYLDAWEPGVANKPVLDIKQGRHPLLTGEVVPVSVHLGIDFNALVITGPNTGGKTVTLKSVGLLVLMAQSGLHVPAEEGTVVGVFHNIFADIGDEQSIEQSLSTFSSHMSNIVNILNNAGPGSLVLLDELGAGTDPTEGAALAQALLDNMQNAEVCTIATTHYSELKNYAYTREHVENASVEFDPVTLRPTYRLLLGKPGRSNAFEIAQRLGLETFVIEKAREFMSREEIEVAELMNKLEEAKHQAEEERTTAEELRQEANSIRDRYLEQEEELNNKKNKIIEKARSDAKEIVRRAKHDSEELIRQLRENKEKEKAANVESDIHNAREKLKKMRGKYTEKEKSSKNKTAASPQDIKAGAEVFVPRFNKKGVVMESPGKGKEVQIQLDTIKINLPVSELQPVEKEDKKDVSSPGFAHLVKDKTSGISTSLDLRGMRVDEALEKMDKYLDDAGISGLNQVFIIHGKGTGALRSAIQEKLKTHAGVNSYRLGKHGEGGSGATVVDLK